MGHREIHLTISPPAGRINQEAAAIAEHTGIASPEVPVHQNRFGSVLVQQLCEPGKPGLQRRQRQPPGASQLKLRTQPQLHKCFPPMISPTGGLGTQSNESIRRPAKTSTTLRKRAAVQPSQTTAQSLLIPRLLLEPRQHQQSGAG